MRFRGVAVAPEWKVYCLPHRELFDAGKLAALGELVRPSKAGDLPSRAVALMQGIVARKEGDFEGEEAACVARILSLIGGFIERHRGCDLRVAAADSGEYVRVVAGQGRPWLAFSIWEDRTYWQLYWGGGFQRTLSDHAAHADRCRGEIERLRRDVAEEQNDILRRRKLEQALERWTAARRSSEEMIDEIARTAEPNRKRAFGIDVLEELRTHPFQSA